MTQKQFFHLLHQPLLHSAIPQQSKFLREHQVDQVFDEPVKNASAAAVPVLRFVHYEFMFGAVKHTGHLPASIWKQLLEVSELVELQVGHKQVGSWVGQQCTERATSAEDAGRKRERLGQ